ncbi:MAG: ABC transporter ATP-binding protein [Planctomycetota bacterium]|nr:MAG: ABC transporter ATP-binding protein [Planctomycetota bacterium]
MSDELRQWLNESRNERKPADPRLAVVPRIRGVPLVGGPRLDLDEEQAASSHEKQTADGRTVRVDAAHGGTEREAAGTQLSVKGLVKAYRKGNHVVPVLRGVDLEIRRGEFVAIVGQSGSGKSTLLHLMGLLDSPDDGEIGFDGRRVDNAPVRVRERLRNERIGMIFQFYHLLPELTALENVLTPIMIGRGVLRYLAERRRYRAEARRLLETVGLSHRLKHKPREMSGGEMQRAAIARALISQPEILLADEPTGNLDRATGQEILALLRALNDRHNLTIVMVTHDPTIAERADRTVRLVDGRVDGDG